MNSTRPHLTPTYSMKLPQRLIQEQDQKQNQSKRARGATAELIRYPRQREQSRPGPRISGNYLTKNIRRITQVASRSVVDENRNISSATVGQVQLPHPRLSQARPANCGTGVTGVVVGLFQSCVLRAHGGADYTFGALAILAFCHPGKPTLAQRARSVPVAASAMRTPL